MIQAAAGGGTAQSSPPDTTQKPSQHFPFTRGGMLLCSVPYVTLQRAARRTRPIGTSAPTMSLPSPPPPRARCEGEDTGTHAHAPTRPHPSHPPPLRAARVCRRAAPPPPATRTPRVCRPARDALGGGTDRPSVSLPVGSLPPSRCARRREQDATVPGAPSSLPSCCHSFCSPVGGARSPSIPHPPLGADSPAHDRRDRRLSAGWPAKALLPSRSPDSRRRLLLGSALFAHLVFAPLPPFGFCAPPHSGFRPASHLGSALLPHLLFTPLALSPLTHLFPFGVPRDQLTGSPLPPRARVVGFVLQPVAPARCPHPRGWASRAPHVPGSTSLPVSSPLEVGEWRLCPPRDLVLFLLRTRVAVFVFVFLFGWLSTPPTPPPRPPARRSPSLRPSI